MTARSRLLFARMNRSNLQPYAPPEWAGSLRVKPDRRVRLAQLPTPIHRWAPPDVETCDLWIKRDDLTGAALSGNKVRKLEFLLADALQRECDVVLTCGGIQSNHARATALAARELGLDSILFLRATEVNADPGLEGNLLLDRLAGAELRLITPEQYRGRDGLLAPVAEELAGQGRRPYVIPEGGSNALGTWGYLQAIEEIVTHLREHDQEFDDVVFACGSGGTAAGVSLALHRRGCSIRPHAVNVCDDARHFYHRVNSIFDELGAPEEAEKLLDVMDGHVGRGYALSTREELAEIAAVSRATGMILDPVYTGKAFIALRKELRRNPQRFRGRRLLFLHTGGLFGLYAYREEIGPALA